MNAVLVIYDVVWEGMYSAFEGIHNVMQKLLRYSNRINEVILMARAGFSTNLSGWSFVCAQNATSSSQKYCIQLGHTLKVVALA